MEKIKEIINNVTKIAQEIADAVPEVVEVETAVAKTIINPNLDNIIADIDIAVMLIKQIRITHEVENVAIIFNKLETHLLNLIDRLEGNKNEN